MYKPDEDGTNLYVGKYLFCAVLVSVEEMWT